MDEQTKNIILTLTEKVDRLERLLIDHEHNIVDGTKILTKNIRLENGQFIDVGYGSQASGEVLNIGATNEQLSYAIALSKQNTTQGFTNKLDALQLNFLHQPNNTSKQSFITALRTPLVTSFVGTSISTTAGGSTVTIDGFNFTTNELAGALISIYTSAGALVETQTIASNTATVITISGTWLSSTSSGKFLVYSPVFLGSADMIWQRFYAQEGTSGGIRIGPGVTNGGQNGLLYMDAAGDLYWRNKGGTSVKLN